MCLPAYYTMIKADNYKKRRREAMVDYAREHSISGAARESRTSRKTVRKWLKRKMAGETLTDRSRRPKTSPSKTDRQTARKVAGARKDTGYGPHRLSDYLRRTEGIQLSPWTIRNILQRKDLTGGKTNRSACYPAHWVWES